MKGRSLVLLAAVILIFFAGYMAGKRSSAPPPPAPAQDVMKKEAVKKTHERVVHSEEKVKRSARGATKTTGKSSLPEKIEREKQTLINLSHNPGRSFFPEIALDGDDNVYVMWLDQASGKLEAQFVKGSKTGWQNIAGEMGFGLVPTSTAIVVDSHNTVHMAFKAKEKGETAIFYTRKTGEGWSEPVNLSEGTSDAYTPRLLIDAQDRLHLIWYSAAGHEASAYYRKRSGGQWGDIEKLPREMNASDWMPDFALSPKGAVNAVTQRLGAAGGASIYYFERTPESGWSQGVKISGDIEFSIRPYIVVGPDGAPHAFWMSGSNEDQDIYYSHKQGGQWTAPVNLTHSGRLSNDPALAVDDKGMIHMVWGERLGKGKHDLFYMSGAGNRWSMKRNLTETDNVSSAPQIRIGKNGVIEVVWHEGKDRDDSDIFYTTIDVP